MKKKIQKIKDCYYLDISLAKANGYEAIMFPLDTGYDAYHLSNYEDMDYIFDVASDYGWDQFILIDLFSNEEQITDLCELEVA